jgi:acyl carrier protein
MDTAEVADRLISFIQETASPEHRDLKIDEDTPLLRLGILDSLKTAMLLNFIHNELKVRVPAEKLIGDNFENVRNIAATIRDIAADSGR